MAARERAAVGLAVEKQPEVPVTDIGTMRVKSGLADIGIAGVDHDVEIEVALLRVGLEVVEIGAEIQVRRASLEIERHEVAR